MDKNVQVINVVEAVKGKFGPQVKLADGSYASFGKFFKGDTALTKGSYKVDLYVTEKGNKYINEVLLATTITAVPVVEAPKKTTVLKAKTSFVPKALDNTMSKEEWAAKDRRIGRAGLFQAAISSPALASMAHDVDGLIELAVKVAEAGLEFVNKKAS